MHRLWTSRITLCMSRLLTPDVSPPSLVSDRRCLGKPGENPIRTIDNIFEGHRRWRSSCRQKSGDLIGVDRALQGRAQAVQDLQDCDDRGSFNICPAGFHLLTCLCPHSRTTSSLNLSPLRADHVRHSSHVAPGCCSWSTASRTLVHSFSPTC
jgi:hypothetical protein